MGCYSVTGFTSSTLSQGFFSSVFGANRDDYPTSGFEANSEVVLVKGFEANKDEPSAGLPPNSEVPVDSAPPNREVFSAAAGFGSSAAFGLSVVQNKPTAGAAFS